MYNTAGRVLSPPRSASFQTFTISPRPTRHMSFPMPFCDRLRSSIDRVVTIQNFSCTDHNGKTIVRGSVDSREEATMCNVVARLVPGMDDVVVEVSVGK